jgi:hypothetical protein
MATIASLSADQIVFLALLMAGHVTAALWAAGHTILKP